MFISGQSAFNNSLSCATIDIIDDNVVEVNQENLIFSISADDPTVTELTLTSATVIINEDDNDGIIKVIDNKILAAWYLD